MIILVNVLFKKGKIISEVKEKQETLKISTKFYSRDIESNAVHTFLRYGN